MKKRNIFQNRSQQLLRLFEKAGNRLKMMCIPIDYAKKDHIVMFCNGYGDIVRKPFSVKNSLEGVKYLIDQVMRSCRQRHIKKEYVFFGGEDVNSYAENPNVAKAGGLQSSGVKGKVVVTFRCSCRWFKVQFNKTWRAHRSCTIFLFDGHTFF